MAKIYRKKYFSNPVNKEKKSKYQKEFELQYPEKKEYRYFLTKIKTLKLNLSYEDYKNLITPLDFKGFDGDQYVSKQNLINDYVLGINPECL